MKKNIYLIALLLSSAFFFSCNREEPEIYIPDKNMTHEQILKLLDDAVFVTNAEKNATRIEEDILNHKEYIQKRVEIDQTAKKKLETRYRDRRAENIQTSDLTYIENDLCYTYMDNSLSEYFMLTYKNDWFWKNVDVANKDVVDDFNYFKWSVQDNKLVGNPISDFFGESMTLSGNISIVLDNKKRFKKIEYLIAYGSSYSSYHCETVVTYEYNNANPQFPKEFDKNMFERSPQYCLIVDWGKEFGITKYWSTEIFYNEEYETDMASVFFDWNEAPLLDGKLPVFYREETFENEYGYVWYFGNTKWGFNIILTPNTDKTTIYAKWINESEVVIPHNAPVKEEAKSPFDILKQKINRI